MNITGSLYSIEECVLESFAEVIQEMDSYSNKYATLKEARPKIAEFFKKGGRHITYNDEDSIRIIHDHIEYIPDDRADSFMIVQSDRPSESTQWKSTYSIKPLTTTVPSHEKEAYEKYPKSDAKNWPNNINIKDIAFWAKHNRNLDTETIKTLMKALATLSHVNEESNRDTEVCDRLVMTRKADNRK